jgi:large repetitive protein
MSSRHTSSIVWILALIAACSSDEDPSGNVECGQNQPCATGFICTSDGRCVRSEGDVDAPSSGTPDSRPSSIPDARVPDAPAPDASPPDAVPVDQSPPNTTLTGPTGSINTTQASFVIMATEAATFECALDGVAFAACTSPVNLSGLAAGNHELAARAIDLAGNVDPTPALATFTVDLTAPVVVLGGAPTNNQTINVATSSLTWAFNPAEPASSTFECAVDGAPTFTRAACANRTYADGAHSFAVRGRDAAGNVGSAQTVAFSVDTVKPTATITSADPANGALSRDSSWVLTFESNEASVTFECLIDGTQSLKPCPTPISPLFDGVKTAQVRAIDLAGNVGDYSSQVSYTLDTRGPNLTNIVGKPPTHDNPNPRAITISWSADEPATYTCTFSHIDNPVECGAGSWTGFELRGQNILEVTAKDTLGNTQVTDIIWQVN